MECQLVFSSEVLENTRLSDSLGLSIAISYTLMRLDSVEVHNRNTDITKDVRAKIWVNLAIS